jgi:serine/threonine protein kinase
MPTGDYQEDGSPTIKSDQSFSGTTAPLKEGRYAGAVFKDRYVIEKKLGAGGIGEVYLARDRQLHSKPVVVKVLLEESGRDEWFKKKFRQEIEALARIDHPGVVGVLDAGDAPDGKPFLVMQYVKGRDLRSMINNEGMSFDQAATIIRQTAHALSAAHDQGVLHCDLKPENIMLQDLGEGEYQVKIVDFGIAKIRDSQVRTGAQETKVAGTVNYMAPEQAQGNPTKASDVFALGVIAYEMLTGRRPFSPMTPFHLIDAVRAGVNVNPKDLRPDLSAEAQEIILKALSFDESERYERARDFGELLAQSLTTDLELPAQNQPEGADIEMAHVLFMDMVGYSKLATDEQTRLVKQLQHIVGNAETFQRAKAGRQLISRSTGDSMALVFFNSPKAPVECAVEIARAISQYPHIKLRMGINSGPVYRVKDMNETVDVAGAGINMAQRVMDCGDDGHILLSKSVADVLGELGEWRSRIHDLGVCKVKHGVTVHIYSLRFAEIGNARAPEKMRKKRKPLVAAMVIGLMILLAAAITVWIIDRSKAPDINSASNADTSSVMSSGVDRVLSYSLTVQQVNDGKPVGRPRQVAGPEESSFKDLDVKFNVSAAQSGYLYVLNELPAGENGSPRYQVLYPFLSEKAQGKVSMVKIPDDESQWIPPLGKEGTRRFWFVWSDNTVEEIESVKSLALQAGGKVEDPARNKAIQDMLVKYLTAKSHTQRDDVKKQTNVMWKGNTLAYELTLKY